MIKKKKIALVSNTSWSIYNFRLGLIRALIKNNFEVYVIAPKDNFSAKLLAENIFFEEITLNNYGTNPLKEISSLRQLYGIYKKIDPDLIFHYTIKPNIYGSIAAYFNKVPSIAITTGLGHLFNFKNKFVSWLTIYFYKIASKLSNEVWFLNDNDRDVFVYKNIVSPNKTKILNGEGIDLNWFKPYKKESQATIKFLFAGRILWDKGIKEFVEAAKYIQSKYANTEFHILGFIDQNNPNSVPYDQISAWQNKGIIKYLGETTDVRPYLNQSSCLIFPSYYREGVSRILMEAAAMETPIITTLNVGCKNIVDHGRNGFLVEPKDVNDLIGKIENFLNLDHEDMAVMGKLGRNKMEREFDQELIISEYLKCIKNYLGRSPIHKSSKQQYHE